MQDQFKHCAALVREADRDRYLAALFAPADRRDALFALYAFSAEISRVRELAREPMPGEIRLQWWREMLLGERDGRGGGPSGGGRAAGNDCRVMVWRRERFAALIEAHRFDIYDEPMASLAELQAYAAATSGTIFECATRILAGSETPPADVVLAAGQAETIADMIEVSRVTRRTTSFMCRWRFCGTTVPSLRCLCHARDGRIACRACRTALARAQTSVADRGMPRFPRSPGRPFCRWRRYGSG